MGALDWVSGAGWFVMWAASLDFWSFERLHYFHVLLIGRMASERLDVLIHTVGLDGDSDSVRAMAVPSMPVRGSLTMLPSVIICSLFLGLCPRGSY